MTELWQADAILAWDQFIPPSIVKHSEGERSTQGSNFHVFRVHFLYLLRNVKSVSTQPSTLHFNILKQYKCWEFRMLGPNSPLSGLCRFSVNKLAEAEAKIPLSKITTREKGGNVISEQPKHHCPAVLVPSTSKNGLSLPFTVWKVPFGIRDWWPHSINTCHSFSKRSGGQGLSGGSNALTVTQEESQVISRSFCRFCCSLYQRAQFDQDWGRCWTLNCSWRRRHANDAQWVWLAGGNMDGGQEDLKCVIWSIWCPFHYRQYKYVRCASVRFLTLCLCFNMFIL